MTDPAGMVWKRGAPIADGCPKGFHYDDWVETNDRSTSGLIRGFLSTNTDNQYCMYLVLLDTGDVVPLMNRALHLVLRVADPEARAAAIAAYKQERDRL